MTDTISDALSEISVPAMLTAYVVVSQARWGEYFGQPGNIVSFVTAASTVAFALVRIYYYWAKTKAVKSGRNTEDE